MTAPLINASHEAGPCAALGRLRLRERLALVDEASLQQLSFLAQARSLVSQTLF